MRSHLSQDISRLREVAAALRQQLLDLSRQRHVGADVKRLLEPGGPVDTIQVTLEGLRELVATDHAADAKMLHSALRTTREQLKKLQAQWDVVDRSLAQQLVEAAADEKGRSLGRWRQRWGQDGLRAEWAYRRLRARHEARLSRLTDKADQGGLVGLTVEDFWIGELYYYSGLTQTQIADVVGLSQPTIGARIPKLDEAVALEVLSQCVDEIAGSEGWRASRDEVTPWNIFIDLCNGKPELRLHAYVLTGRTRQSYRRASALDFLAEVQAVLRVYHEGVEGTCALTLKEPEPRPGLAVYDMSDQSKGLYLVPELLNAQLVVRPDPSDPEVWLRNIRSLVPAQLSIVGALERAEDAKRAIHERYEGDLAESPGR